MKLGFSNNFDPSCILFFVEILLGSSSYIVLDDKVIEKKNSYPFNNI